MTLVEGSKYCQNPVGTKTPYFPLTLDILEYLGMGKDEEFHVWFIPDTNSRGQRFIGFWLEKKQ